MNDDNNPEVILDIEGPAATLEAEDGDVPLKDNGALIVNRRRDAYIGPSVHGPNNSHPNVLFGAGKFVLTKGHSVRLGDGRQFVSAEHNLHRANGLIIQMSPVLFKRITILLFSLNLMVLYPKQSMGLHPLVR